MTLLRMLFWGCIGKLNIARYLSIVIGCLILCSPISAQSLLVTDISWNSDSTLLAIAYNNDTVEITTPESQIISVIPFAENVMVVEWSSSNPNLLAVTTLDSDTYILTLNFDEQESLPTVSISLISDTLFNQELRWNSDDTRLAGLGPLGSDITEDYFVTIWDNTGAIIGSYNDGYTFTDIEWNPQNADQLLVSGVADMRGLELVLLDFSQPATPLWTIYDPDFGFTDVAWSPDGNMFATLAQDITELNGGNSPIRVHDASSGNLISMVTEDSIGSMSIAWFPSEYLIAYGLAQLDIWDVTTSEIIDSIEFEAFIMDVAISHDGEQIAISLNSDDVIFELIAQDN